MDNFYGTPRKAVRTAFPIILLLSVVQFLFYYVSNYLFPEAVWFLYSAYFIGRLINSFIPVFAAMAIFLCTPSAKLRAGYSLLLGLARFGYTVPHRYIELVTDVYDSLEALLLALVMTLGLAVLFSIEIFLYDFIIRLTMKKCTAVDPHGAPLDFDNHLTFGILMASATRFILNLIGEIYDIVLYLINNAPYRLTEIAFLVVSLIMTILFCLITHVACCLIKNRIA